MSNEKKGVSDKSFEEGLKDYFSPKEKKEKPSVTGGIPFFSWFFYWLGKILSKLSKGIWILLIFLLFAAFLVFLYNYFYGAQQGAVLYEHAKVAVEETGVPILTKLGLTGIYRVVTKPETLYTTYSFESDIEKNKENQDLGLKITDLNVVGGTIYSGKPVFIRGTIKAQSLDRPIIAGVDCSLEDYKDKAEVVAPVSEEGGKIKIYQDIAQTYTVGCNFKNGISVPAPTTGFVGKTRTPLIAREAKMSVEYNFITKASHNTYFLNGGIANALLTRGENPFSYFKVNDPQLKSDRTITSKTTIGPINLGIGTFDSQPFSEGIPYFFGVSLSNNINFNGYLKKLSRLEIRLPPNMVVSGESGFGNGGTCDFYYTGRVDENGFKIYSLKDEKKDESNIKCSPLDTANLKEIQAGKMTLDQCINLWKSNLNYLCQFKIVEPIIGDSMYLDFIRAEADYIYETSKKTVVNIVQTPGIV